MNNNFEKDIFKIKENSVQCGISSDEVVFAKQLVGNKNPEVKYFVCEGLWAVDKLIEKQFKVVNFLFNVEALSVGEISEEDLAKILKMVKYSEKSCAISEKACQKISDRDGYDEYFIIVEIKNYSLNDIEKMFSNKKDIIAIVMDGLEQPGNIGAILRSFDCAGGDFAIITNRHAKINNSRIVRSSLGASFMIPVVDAKIDEAQKWLEKNYYRCVVTDLQARKSYRDICYDGKIAIIAGNEHTGISNSWRKVKNAQSVIIPMMGSCESLNVGFAATLVAYEAGLRKHEKK